MKPPGISTRLYFSLVLVLVIINITKFSNTVQYSAFIYENHFDNLNYFVAAAAASAVATFPLVTTINSLIFDHLKGGGGILCCAFTFKLFLLNYLNHTFLQHNICSIFSVSFLASCCLSPCLTLLHSARVIFFSWFVSNNADFYKFSPN